MTSRAEQIFFEIFEPLPRQGPGNLACAERALALCAELPVSPRVLDLGCGSGAQTLHLAALVLISGLPGAGKTSTARQVAASFSPSMHLEVDQLRAMMVRGYVAPDEVSGPSLTLGP